MPLGRDLVVSSESHVGFHVAWKGMSNMGARVNAGEVFWLEAVVDVLAELLCREVVSL